MSATRSMGTRLGMLRAAVANLERVLDELKDKPSILEVEAFHIQRLEQAVIKRFESIADKWVDLEDEDNFVDAAEGEKCKSDYNEAEKIHESILNG